MWFRNSVIHAGSVLGGMPSCHAEVQPALSVCLRLQGKELGWGWKERSSWQENWSKILGESCHVLLLENARYKMPLSHFTDQPKGGYAHLAWESWLRLTNKGHIAFKIFSSWEFEYLLLLTQTIMHYSRNTLWSCISVFWKRNRILTICSALKGLYALLLIGSGYRSKRKSILNNKLF